MRRVPLEANVACLDAALACLLAFIEGIENVTKIRSLVLSSLIEKGLGAARTSTKSRVLEILLELVAADCADPIIVQYPSIVYLLN